jgi:acetyltransferase-like isoleucine patch superfamily enzyme
MNSKARRSWSVFKYLRWVLSFDRSQSPLFVHGLLCLMWRLADFVPARIGFAVRWFIGKYRLGRLGKFPRIHSHNIFFDGRNVIIGDYFYSGKYNYFAGGPIRIGDQVSLANFVIIETTGHYFDDPSRSFREQGVHKKTVVIGDNVWIGDRATILGGVTIGDGAIIGAGAVVARDIPPDSVAVGNPVRVIRKRGETAIRIGNSESSKAKKTEGR